MLSIIIPTKNEEKLLPLLLDSIQKQSLNCEYEIIVADAGSSDRTCDIAREYGCRIIGGGMPAQGRNKGAAAARGDILLFLDADVVVRGDLERAIAEFEGRRLDVASCYLQTLSEVKFFRIMYEVLYNFPIRLLESTLPHGADFMLVRKELHQRIDGFDEEVVMSEDHDYMRRGAKFGKFGLLCSAKIITSPRRYEQDGWIKVCLKFLACELYMVFFGPVKRDIFLYRFEPYSEEKRIYKTPSSQYRGIKKLLLPFWFTAVLFWAMVWYIVVVSLFVLLNIKKGIAKSGTALGRIFLAEREAGI